MSRRIPKPAEEPAPQACPVPEIDLSVVAETVADHDPSSQLITIMQKLQGAYGYLPETVVDQYPDPGAPAKTSDEVILTVSKMPAAENTE